MNQEIKQSFSLKLREEPIDPENIWKKHDALEREAVAASLTNLIEGEENSLVISVSGGWGTGKTFLLQRWQCQLKKDGFESIYFNAWEDDFCDDPLVAIVGQLIKSFKSGKLAEITDDNIKEHSKEIIKQALSSVIHLATGVHIDLDKFTDETLSRYSYQRGSKERLRRELEKMAVEVRKDTQKPLIFIIDELDRCRPTFAIELLERVKHIFDIPNIIFVFGINRDELCKSLRSIYGRIKAEVYLRRFFDMEFNLPPPNSQSFCKYSMQKCNLSACLSSRAYAYGELEEFLPTFYSYFDLSLRDIDYCIRSFIFVGKNILKEKEGYMLPSLLGVLIMLRLIKPSIYERFIRGKQPAREIMNYIHKCVPMDELNTKDDLISRFKKLVILLEAEFYSMDTNPSAEPSYPQRQLEQLKLLENKKELPEERYLSSWIQQTDSVEERGDKVLLLREQVEKLMDGSYFNGRRFDRGIPVTVLSNLMDITKMEIHRG